MATRPKGEDRRVRRTRQSIRNAAVEVAREKGVLATSVQEIAERANVSRGTFYAHYEDKNDLVAALARKEFQRMVRLPPASQGGEQALRLLIHGALVYVRDVYQRHRQSREVAQVIEQIIHNELAGLLLAWLEQGNRGEASPPRPLETMATAMSWGIYGVAVQWCEQANGTSLEQIADELIRFIGK